MKVLIINVVCGVKSTGHICCDLAEELENRGHEVKIAYGRENVPDNYSRFAHRIGDDVDVKIHAGLARMTDSAGFHSVRVTRRFVEWIKIYDPDVINLHNIHGYYLNVGVLFDYLRVCNKKIVWTLHDCWPFTGHSALCDGDGCEKWEKGCHNCPQRNVYPKSIIDRSKKNWERKKKLFKGIPDLRIITPSQWMKSNVSRSFLKEYPVEVINNGIRLDLFCRKDGGSFRKTYDLKDKFIVLGVATAWGYKKGYDDFVKLSTMLDDRFKVVLVGVDAKLRTAAYPNLLTLGLTKNVDELVEIYSESDVFANLTYCDTFPTVNLEARACGLPIITYDTGGSPEAAGEKAKVVKKGNIDGVYRWINGVGQNQEFLGLRKNDIDMPLDYGTSIKKYIGILE